ncbi:unnamed protein product [Miscanthus lutarioriparius]|uniref:Cytochrome P450 n=1 Tax=Miscanthus lutarioriparius TaxID=422564 RepID=A0A811PMQ9_9POAL|nr:unnamed protein product [Miscanthus lutarioriparius]
MGTGAAALVAAALAVVVVTRLWTVLVHLVWRPYAVARAFGRQGVRGPPYRVFVGNSKEIQAMRAATSGDTLDLTSHDYIPRVMPQYRAWMSLYGKVFLTWSSSTPALFVGSYDMVKRVLFDKSGLYGKTDPGPTILSLMGMGLVFTDGDDWSRHRRVVHPAFAMDKLKSMTGAMAEVIRGEEARAAASASGEGVVTVEVGQQFTELTADVISHTAFGSSYRQGKEVFLAQRELQFIAFASIDNVCVPGMHYVPTKANVRRWQLERTVRGTLMAIIGERLDAAKEARGYGSDLLGLMLEANAAGDDGKRQQQAMSMDEIIDECKTFFFAGHDTTSHLLTWAMFLLGTHPEWQQRLREEVIRECVGAEVPLRGDALNKLKLVTMVLYETLRLYGSVPMIARQPTADADLCGVKRSCIGQDFAMLEAKATLALILRRFAFEVAPEYVHAPADFLTLQPSKGLPVVLRLLDPHTLAS